MWSAPVNPGVGASLGHIRLLSGSAAAAGRATNATLSDVKPLAAALAEVWNELARTRRALWQREAELAAGVPVATRSDEEQHLAARLEASIAAGAEAIDCQAAGLYLLDAGTSELKLRSSYGLPRTRLTEPARPLRGAAADLEALLGHAVVLSDERMFEYWRVPEPCASAVCVPVSSPTTPLGTLWLFSHTVRDFTAAQTNMIEVVAGRLAAELEREMLFCEVEALRASRPKLSVRLRGHMARAASPSPRLDGWDIAGEAPSSASGVEDAGQRWCDWFAVAYDHLAISLGACSGDPATATAARAGVRTAASLQVSPAQLMSRLNAALWSGDHAGASLGLGYGMLDTHHGMLNTAVSGPVGLALFRGGQLIEVRRGEAAIGTDDELMPNECHWRMQTGDLAVYWGGELAATVSATAAVDACVTAALEKKRRLGAAQLAARVAAALGEQVGETGTWAALVVRRQAKTGN